MKRTTLFTFLSLFFIISGNSQNTFNKGDKVVNLGVGLGNTLYIGSGYSSKTPPISATFEMGVKDELFDEKSSLGIGGYLGYSGATWEYLGWGWKYSNVIIGIRGVGHYQLWERFDTYSGILLGYDIVTTKEIGTIPGYTNYNKSTSGLAWSWFVGGRYYFTEKFSGMLELGYGIAYLNLGVSMKL